jgi:hypothetical protein
VRLRAAVAPVVAVVLLIAVLAAATFALGLARCALVVTDAPPPPPTRPPAMPQGELLLTVAFMGDDHGELEPCGCTQGMLGGLARRPARLDASREPGVPMVVVA